MEAISLSAAMVMIIICLVLLLVLFLMIYGINLKFMDRAIALIDAAKCICLFLLLVTVFYLIFNMFNIELILKYVESYIR